MNTVKLVPKNVFANKLLDYVGEPDYWIVKRQQESVTWAPSVAGPWLFVAPNNDHRQRDRWVSLTDDNDFIVEIVS